MGKITLAHVNNAQKVSKTQKANRSVINLSKN